MLEPFTACHSTYIIQTPFPLLLGGAADVVCPTPDWDDPVEPTSLIYCCPNALILFAVNIALVFSPRQLRSASVSTHHTSEIPPGGVFAIPDQLYRSIQSVLSMNVCVCFKKLLTSSWLSHERPSLEFWIIIIRNQNALTLNDPPHMPIRLPIYCIADTWSAFGWGNFGSSLRHLRTSLS